MKLSPDEAAAWWLARLDAPNLGRRDRRNFADWRAASGENEEAFHRAEAVWRASKAIAAEAAIVRMREAALNASKPCLVWPRPRALLGVAASFALLIFTGAALVLSPSSMTAMLGDARDWFRLQPDHGLFSTSVGERSAVTLQDGSIVTLNTDSAAVVSFTDQERLVTLTRGQALFEVARNQTRPFVVQAGDRRVVATGTAFDVRLTDEEVQVTLLEGHVIVDPDANQKTSDARLPLARTELQPGERLVARRGTPISVKPANVERIISWRSGQLVFLDQRLDETIAEVNRYTQTPIILESDDVAGLHINGVFRTGQPLEFALAVEEIYGLKVEQLRDEIRLGPR